MARPRVDVVVPFSGGPDALRERRARLSRLRLQDSDTIVVVDNTPGCEPEGASGGRVPVLAASARATPGYARNRGAERGSGEWLVFLDADTEPPADLLDRYFDPPPAGASRKRSASTARPTRNGNGSCTTTGTGVRSGGSTCSTRIWTRCRRGGVRPRSAGT